MISSKQGSELETLHLVAKESNEIVWMFEYGRTSYIKNSFLITTVRANMTIYQLFATPMQTMQSPNYNDVSIESP